MSRKTILSVLSLLLTASMILSACAPAAPAANNPTAAPQLPAPTTAPAITVTFWHGMSNPETEQFSKVIAAFEAKNPGIQIKATRYSTDDDSFKKALLTASAGNSFPDTARVDIAAVPQYANDGVLYQLDGNMPDFAAISSSVFPGPLSTNYWSGHYYGLPMDTNTQVLLWNKSLFEAAGLKDAPKTMAEFADDACKLTDKAKEVYGYAEGGTYFWAPAPIFYAMGGQVVDDKMTTATGYINGKAAVETFTLLKDLYTKGCLSPNIMGGGIPTDAGHATGKYAMIIDGPWMVDIYKSNYPDFQVNFALIPTGADGKTSSVVGGEDVVVFNNAKNKEAASKWISFLASAEAQKLMAQVGVMPTVASLRGDPALPSYFGIFMDQLQTAQARVPHPAWPQMDDAINQAYQRILRGEDVQTSLDTAASEINALLNQ
jgi:multiple sugar transport system substrate-binding protein